MVTQATEQITSQFINAGLNKKQWGSIGYNAIVEGVVEGGVTDTTVALQTLVNKAITEGRKTIFLPHITNGQYRVTTLTNADQVDFVGDNSSFVGGYTGTIGDLGGFTALEADYAKEVAPVFNVLGYGALGNGVADDTAEIQAAITAASTAGGGTVFFPYTSSFYLISNAILVPSNVTLLGDWNRPKIKQTGTGASFETGAVILNTNYADGAGGNTNIHIVNLTLENRYQEFLVASAVVPEFLYGVFLGNVSKTSVIGCHILNTVSEGIYIGHYQTSEDVIIENNRIENCFASGIAITNGRKIRVSNNYVYNTRIFGIDLEPNTSCEATDIIVSGNQIDTVDGGYYKNKTTYGITNGSMGISVQSGSVANQTHDIVVTNNTLRNINRDTATALSDFGAITCVGALRVTIGGNTIYGGECPGINIRQSTHVNVNGGTLSGLITTAVYITSSSYVTVEGLSIDTPTGVGIQITLSNSVSCRGNIILNPNAYGFYLSGNTVLSLDGNIMIDSRAGGARTMTYGIYVLSGNDGYSLNGNIVKNSVSDGIKDTDGSTNGVNFGSMEDNSWRIKSSNIHIFSDGNIYKMGWAILTAVAAVNVVNNTLFIDSADTKLKFKNAAGVVNLLY